CPGSYRALRRVFSKFCRLRGILLLCSISRMVDHDALLCCFVVGSLWRELKPACVLVKAQIGWKVHHHRNTLSPFTCDHRAILVFRRTWWGWCRTAPFP